MIIIRFYFILAIFVMLTILYFRYDPPKIIYRNEKKRINL